MLVLILAMVTILSLSSCSNQQDTIYVESKSPKLKTFEVSKSEAETKELNINYRVVER